LTSPITSFEQDQAKRFSRAVSPIFSQPPTLRTSWSVADLSSATNPNQPVPANTSAKRLSFMTPQAFNPMQSHWKSGNVAPPQNRSVVARHSAMFSQQTPQGNIGNGSRAPLRGKHSLPNMGLAGLPPPMPPPNCPLPRVPSGVSYSGPRA